MFGRCGLLLLFGFGAVSLLASPAAAQQHMGATHRVTAAAHDKTHATKSSVGPNSSERINKFNRLRYASRPARRAATATIVSRPSMGWLGIRG